MLMPMLLLLLLLLLVVVSLLLLLLSLSLLFVCDVVAVAVVDIILGCQLKTTPYLSPEHLSTPVRTHHIEAAAVESPWSRPNVPPQQKYREPL